MALIYLVAGEASGDVLGARLMQALRQIHPELSFAGIGGAMMAASGMDSLFPMQELSLMGLVEILPNITRLKRRLEQTASDIAARKPAMVVTIDSPGFSLRLLRRIAGLGLRRVHYVAPQVWAWRPGRVKHFPGLWDRLLCLLPFEPAFFEPHGLAPVFVGHPVLESGADRGDAQRFRTAFSLPPAARPLILMPGSRRSELSRLLPIFRTTLDRLTADHPDLVPVLAAAPAMTDRVRREMQDWRVRPLIVSDPASRYDAFAASIAALTKSGTSTLELAMAGVPMVVTYRVHPATAAIARRLVTVDHAAIVNLLAGRGLVPELIQQDCTPPKLIAALSPLLQGGPEAATQRAGFAQIASMLTPPSGDKPSMAAAKAILELL
ncbi:MAG: lipid-A-disaccharide synthase [Acidiphilium sp.]